MSDLIAYLNITLSRYTNGLTLHTDVCFMIELRKDAVSHFQHLSSVDNSTTPSYRYSPNLPYDWNSTNRLPWNAFERPEPQLTPPYKHQHDRQIALATYINLTQGAFMCANGGQCVAPDVCSCANGWIGFDCRVPVCEQGFYEPEQESFVKGVKSDQDFAIFEPFLDPRRPYDLDSSRSFSSNPDLTVWIERFEDQYSVLSQSVTVNGTRYLALNGTQFQGGYECSIRSVSQWENYRSGFVFSHPNYYSRYMNEKVEDDGLVYSHWKGMNFPATHRKSATLVKFGDEYLHQSNDVKDRFVYTDVGYMTDGIWEVTGARWSKGHCIVEFERHCGDDSFNFSAVLVQDTDEVSLWLVVFFDIVKLEHAAETRAFSHIDQKSHMMRNALKLQADGLPRNPMCVLIMLYVAATTTGRVSRLIHACVPRDGRVQIAVSLYASKPVFIMAIAPIQIPARKHEFDIYEYLYRYVQRTNSTFN